MAQDVFQMRMDQITERLPGITGKRTSLQQQKMSDKQATDYIFWHNLLSPRDEARSHKDTGITRHSDTTDPETITVIPGTCKLFATIPS